MSRVNDPDGKEPLLSAINKEVEIAHGDLKSHRVWCKPERKWRLWLELSSLIAVFLVIRAYYTHSSWHDRLAMAAMYSPLYRDLDKLHVEKMILGDELWANESNIYRQSPAKVVDEAWERLAYPRFTLVTEETATKMGKPLDPIVRWPDEPDKLIMSLHAPHVMHCLDVLRRNAYHNFLHYYPDGNVNTIHWIHWGHCLEILRQELMCRPSMHLYSMVWQEGQLMPFPDFHIQQSCVRWEDFTDMATQRMVKDDEIKDRMKNMRRPEGALQRYTPPEGWNVIKQNAEWRHKMKEQEVDTEIGT